jgi:nucleoside-diphosphate-sugar epimerase
LTQSSDLKVSPSEGGLKACYPLFAFIMPTIDQGSKVLVTGANGYIAMWIVRRLLERGYSVRASVRSSARGTHLQDYFKHFNDRFELSFVADLTKVYIVL